MHSEVTGKRPLLTRREAAAFVTAELGRPLSFSTLEKLSTLGEGPPVECWWGRRPLYEPETLRAWAEARGRPSKQLDERAQRERLKPTTMPEGAGA